MPIIFARRETLGATHLDRLTGQPHYAARR